MIRFQLCWIVVAIMTFPSLAEAQQQYDFYQSNAQQLRSSKGGYQKLEITAQTKDGKPVRYERRFNVCIQNGYWQKPTVSSKPLIIEAGKSVGVTKVLFKYTGNNDYYWWVERDFNNRRDARDVYTGYQTTSTFMTVDSQSYLFLSSDSQPTRSLPVRNANGLIVTGSSTNVIASASSPSFEHLSGLLPEASSFNGGMFNKQNAIQSPSIRVDLPANLPENWVELSNVQNIFISLDDLILFAQNNPEKANALKQWLAAGGRLIVNSCGERCLKSQQIYRALKIPVVPTPEWKRLKDEQWTSSKSLFLNSRKRGFGVDLDFLENSRNGEIYNSEMFDAVSLEKAESENFPPIVSHFAQGQIVAIDDDMTQWKKADWQLLLATIEAGGADFHTNIGSIIVDGGGNWSRTIPGVVEPSRNTFQFLIVCFVLVAGPLNYFLLNKAKRLNAILLTVPLISLVACLSLFGYAFFVQGFGTKVRHDSVTYLDQRNQVAVNRGIHDLFSGLHPGKYEFDEELVFVASETDSDKRNLIEQNGDSFKFSGGAIQARTPHQLSTVRSFNTKQGLAVDRSGDQMQIGNGFFDDIELLIFKEANQFYVLENLAAGKSGTASKITSSDARLAFANQLDELCGTKLAMSQRTTIQRDGSKRLSFDVPTKSVSSWGVNSHILDTASLQPLNQPGTYMAVFESYSGAPPIRENAQMTSGAHVVVGKW